MATVRGEESESDEDAGVAPPLAVAGEEAETDSDDDAAAPPSAGAPPLGWRRRTLPCTHRQLSLARTELQDDAAWQGGAGDVNGSGTVLTCGPGAATRPYRRIRSSEPSYRHKELGAVAPWTTARRSHAHWPQARGTRRCAGV